MVNPSSGELTDPVFGVHKALVIAYAHNGKIGLWTRRDDRTVSLPEARNADNESASTEPTLDDLDFLRPRAEEIKDLGIEGLSKLEKLDLTNKYIDGPGLVHLRGLKGLRTLSLQDTRVDDAGLKNLGGLTELRSLNLRKTPIGDAAMESIARLVGLKELYIDQTKVTSVGDRPTRQAEGPRDPDPVRNRCGRRWSSCYQEHAQASDPEYRQVREPGGRCHHRLGHGRGAKTLTAGESQPVGRLDRRRRARPPERLAGACRP